MKWKTVWKGVLEALPFYAAGSTIIPLLQWAKTGDWKASLFSGLFGLIGATVFIATITSLVEWQFSKRGARRGREEAHRKAPEEAKVETLSFVVAFRDTASRDFFDKVDSMGLLKETALHRGLVLFKVGLEALEQGNQLAVVSKEGAVVQWITGVYPLMEAGEERRPDLRVVPPPEES